MHFPFLILATKLVISQIEPMPPPFCEGQVLTNIDQGSFVPGMIDDEGLDLRTLSYIAGAWCKKPNDAERLKKVAEWRELMAESLGWSAEMTVDALRARVDADAFVKSMEGTCEALTEGTSESRLAFANSAAVATVLGWCEQLSNDQLLDWLAAESPNPSPVVKAAVVKGCAWHELARSAPGRKNRMYADTRFEGREANAMARCLIEAADFDAKATIAAIDADTRVNELGKQVARENVASIVRGLDLLKADAHQRIAKEPDLKKLLIDVPEKQNHAWLEHYNAHRDAYERVTAIEHTLLSGRVSAMKGCSAPARGVFLKAIAQSDVDPRYFQEYWLDSLRIRAAKVLAICEKIDGFAGTAAGVSGEYMWEPQGRGRTMFIDLGFWSALRDVLKDRPKFALRLPPERDESSVHFDKKRQFESSYDALEGYELHPASREGLASAPVQSVAVKGELATITFKKEHWFEYVPNCVETNKIAGINPLTGQIRYVEKCNGGTNTPHSGTQPPIVVPAAYTSGIKPGQFLSFACDWEQPKSACVPVFGFESPKKQKLVTFFGQPVHGVSHFD